MDVKLSRAKFNVLVSFSLNCSLSHYILASLISLKNCLLKQVLVVVVIVHYVDSCTF